MQSHIMRLAVQVTTVCRCAIYWTLYSKLSINISFLTHQLNGVGPDQTQHYVTSHLGSHCLYITVPFVRYSANRLDGHDVTTNVANYDISAKNAGPDQMSHYVASHLGSHCLYYVLFMGHSAH